MCNQYQAHNVFFYYACINYDVRGYIKSSCRDECNRFSYYKIHCRKGILRIKYQFHFIFMLNKFRFNLHLVRKPYFWVQNVYNYS